MTAIDFSTQQLPLLDSSGAAAGRGRSNDVLARQLVKSSLLNIVINTTAATPPTDATAIWYLADAAGAADGKFKAWNGTSPATTAANWPNITAEDLLGYLARSANARSLQDLAKALMGDATAKGTIAAAVGGTGPSIIASFSAIGSGNTFSNFNGVSGVTFTGGEYRATYNTPISAAKAAAAVILFSNHNVTTVSSSCIQGASTTGYMPFNMYVGSSQVTSPGNFIITG
jgi:hypothetical protein